MRLGFKIIHSHNMQFLVTLVNSRNSSQFS